MYGSEESSTVFMMSAAHPAYGFEECSTVFMLPRCSSSLWIWRVFHDIHVVHCSFGLWIWRVFHGMASGFCCLLVLPAYLRVQGIWKISYITQAGDKAVACTERWGHIVHFFFVLNNFGVWFPWRWNLCTGSVGFGLSFVNQQRPHPNDLIRDHGPAACVRSLLLMITTNTPRRHPDSDGSARPVPRIFQFLRRPIRASLPHRRRPNL